MNPQRTEQDFIQTGFLNIVLDVVNGRPHLKMRPPGLLGDSAHVKRGGAVRVLQQGLWLLCSQPYVLHR